MSYGIQYWSTHRTERNQDCLILIAQKDVPERPTTVPFIIEGDLILNDDSDEGIIIARSATFNIHADDFLSEIDWDTFMTDNYDEWWIIIYLDGHALFEGFIVPEEGNRPLLDRPYPIKITASNGLKLLKDVSLTDFNGVSFKGKYTLLQYIIGALSKTFLNNISDPNGIPLRIYSSLYEPSMAHRGEDITACWFHLAKLDHRTFQSDATSFMSCYDALVTILGRHSRLFYWNARWVIDFMPEHQYMEQRYYTEYAANGTILNGTLDPETHASFGKSENIYPIEEDPFMSSTFAIKFAKTRYPYIVWPEIPLNNRFDRGQLIDQGPAIDETDIDGDSNVTETIGTYKEFFIDDWTKGKNTGGSSNNALPALTPADETFTMRRIYSIYNVELYRYLIIPYGASVHERWLQSEGIPVRAGDKFNLSYDFRISKDLGQFSARTAYVYIKGSGSIRWSLLWEDNITPKWYLTSGGTANRGITRNWEAGEDSRKWVSFSVESPAIPIDGVLYIVLANNVPSTNFNAYFTAFNFEYIPYVAGGYIPVKGDYWQHNQNKNILDKDDEEIGISDSPLQVVRGALFRNDGSPTSFNWARWPTIESKHFKEIVNLWRFNARYRRYLHIEGLFDGVEFEPENDELNKQPLSYHKRYLQTDLATPRHFLLMPPLEQNISKGHTTAIFDEILNPGAGVTEIDTIDEVIAKLAAAINTTGTAQWQSMGLAPALGTPYFPPTAGVYTLSARSIIIDTHSSSTPIASADANGTGNSPIITQTYISTAGARTIIIFQLGSDIEVGNRFTITIFGVAVTIEVEATTFYPDGTQEGDTREFNYLF